MELTPDGTHMLFSQHEQIIAGIKSEVALTCAAGVIRSIETAIEKKRDEFVAGLEEGRNMFGEYGEELVRQEIELMMLREGVIEPVTRMAFDDWR